MKRKILFIVNSLCFGGAEKHVVTLLNHLSPQDTSLSLAFLKDDTTLLPQIDRTKVPEILQLQTTRKVDWGAISKLANHIDNSEIDLIVCTNVYPLLYGFFARARSKRKPQIIEVFHTTTLNTTAEKLKMAVFFRHLFAKSNALVYVCDAQRASWESRGLRSRAVQVIHNGIDIEYFRDRYSADEKSVLRHHYGFTAYDHVVGICASMRPEKAHVDLLSAIAQLKKRGVSIKALLIGDGVERPRIEQKISELNLDTDIRITGFSDDVRPLLAICDIVAITSRHETFSIAALEAMALNKPMIMSETGGATEQITPGINGYLYPAGDIEALAQALFDSMGAGKCITLGRNARAVVEERFSLPTMVRAFEKLFSSMAPDNKKQAYPSLAP